MIAIEDIAKRYGNGELVLRHVSLSIAEGQFFTLLGPSGCGKTTLLRCIAGLERPEAGRMAVRGTTVFDQAAATFVPPNRRNVGMVFQSYAIWPHMTVLENVAFPARARRLGNPEQSALAALKRVGLDHLKDRSATQLSGGQQQRVALARAIATEPDVLLLDEPLSNLDAALRDQMRNELKSLQSRIGITTVLVTHDQAEALSLSDTIAVMESGRIVEVGSPEALYKAPTQAFTARFLGDPIELPVTVETGPDGAPVASTPLGILKLPRGRFAAGPGTLFIKTERLILHPKAESGASTLFAATVAARRFLGAGYEYVLVTSDGGKELRIKNTEQTTFDVGRTVFVEAPEDALIVLPLDGADA
jgi:ABC-type Fe3+/spermidine/putrescine transport system ATPase subunit